VGLGSAGFGIGEQGIDPTPPSRRRVVSSASYGSPLGEQLRRRAVGSVRVSFLRFRHGGERLLEVGVRDVEQAREPGPQRAVAEAAAKARDRQGRWGADRARVEPSGS
jgi:hypothetical protein